MRTYLTLFSREENLFLPVLYVSAEAKGDVTRWLANPKMQFWRGWEPSLYLAETLHAADVQLHPGGALDWFTKRAEKIVRAMQEIARRDKQERITVAAPPSMEEAVGAPKLRLTREA